jgi:hypothetical protein
MKMMNNTYNIVSYADLVREEVRVKKRIKKQEALIKDQLKILPEEIVTTGITKIFSGILSGNLFKSAFSIIKTVGTVVSEIKGEKSHSGGLMNMIKNLVKDKLSN